MSQGTFEWDNQTKEELKQRDDRFQNSIDDAYLSSHQQPCDCAVCDEIHFNRSMNDIKRQDWNELYRLFVQIAYMELKSSQLADQALLMQHIAKNALTILERG